MDYKFDSLGESIFLSIPEFNFLGMVNHSPDRRYAASGSENILAVIDTQMERLIFVYDIFENIDNSKILITNNPYVVVRDIVGSVRDRRNDIYLLNHQADILFKQTIYSHIYCLSVSNNAEYVACQLANCELLLYKVSESSLVASWKPPKLLATKIEIDCNEKIVMLIDYKGNVYSYKFD